MATAGKPTPTHAIPSLRWWIGALLFASTIINYIDRQTLSLLAPYLKIEYHWTNSDYASIVIAFRIAYSIGQTVFGRVMDRIGRLPRKPFRSGSRNANAAWRPPSLIAGHPSEERLRLLSFYRSISVGDGVQRS